jgi:RNA polymerase sigma-70 factor (ECF subfamily)
MEATQCTERFISKVWIIDRYEIYKTMLYRIAFSYIGNKHDCEDILQEAFIKLCYYAPEFTSEEDERRWVIRVTINLCKNHLRSFWNRNKVNLDDLAEYSIEPEDNEIWKDILKLPGKYKAVIHLHYFEGYKVKEIADILKISESAVKMRLMRGRELIKIELEGYYEG